MVLGDFLYLLINTGRSHIRPRILDYNLENESMYSTIAYLFIILYNKKLSKYSINNFLCCRLFLVLL